MPITPSPLGVSGRAVRVSLSCPGDRHVTKAYFKYCGPGAGPDLGMLGSARTVPTLQSPCWVTHCLRVCLHSGCDCASGPGRADGDAVGRGS